MKRMSADEAAEIIQHDQMVAFSGFTPAGSPKALPRPSLAALMNYIGRRSLFRSAC